MLATLIIILFLARLAICLPSMPPTQYLPALSDQLAQNNLNTLRSSTSHLCSVCVEYSFSYKLIRHCPWKFWLKLTRRKQELPFFPRCILIKGSPFMRQLIRLSKVTPIIPQTSTFRTHSTCRTCSNIMSVGSPAD